MAYSRYATEMKDEDNNIYGLMDEEARAQLSDLNSAFTNSSHFIDSCVGDITNLFDKVSNYQVTWSQGKLYDVNGGTVSSNYHVRTGFISFTEKCIVIKSNTPVLLDVFEYTTGDSTSGFTRCVMDVSLDDKYAISAKQERYYRLVIHKIDGSTISPSDALLSNINVFGVKTINKSISDTTSDIRDCLKGFYEEPVTIHLNDNAFISNRANIGETLEDVKYYSTNNYKCIGMRCKKNDIFILTISGGSTALAYAFTDNNFVVIDRSNENEILSNINVVAADDGYIFINSKSSFLYDIKYVKYIKSASLKNEIDTIIVKESKNMIKFDQINTSIYYSPSSTALALADNSLGVFATGFIEVKPGETYILSGTLPMFKGGYFANDSEFVLNEQAIDNITFTNPVTGEGKCFTVPENKNIKYIALNMYTELYESGEGTCQLERGEIATSIQPFNEKTYINPECIKGQSTSDQTDWRSKVPVLCYENADINKISNFANHFIKKDKNIVVVGTGTSLTARSSEHCTDREDATSRPPLMHSNNFASRIWDRLKWDGQHYRRFDYPNFFAETGTFESTHNDSAWDDGEYRYGLTRFASGAASVRFEIPQKAWQFNFIYRSETNGSENATITVSEGNLNVEVFNGTTWVEANGYTFSMKETSVILSSVILHSPNTQNNPQNITRTNYMVGGNTTYQKRVYMRCKSENIDSRDQTKEIIIYSTNGRLLYWGVEWSDREYMITYINSARGSHNMTSSSDRALQHFQDNDIWSFKPDLIFTENPIHNSGGSAGEGAIDKITDYWGNITNNFFFNTNEPISLVSRAVANGIDITNLEWIIFNTSISWIFDGIDNNGDLILCEDSNGKMLSGLDEQELANEWIKENKPSVLTINACKYWCDAARILFGNLKDATIGSGKNGYTFTNDGGHWNDKGSEIIDRCVGSIFNLYNQ